MNHDLDRRFSPNRRVLLAGMMGSAVSLGLTAGAALAQDSDAHQILMGASQRLADIVSLHFTLDIEGETWIDDTRTLKLESAEGDLERPDRVAVEFRISLFGAGTVSIKMITVGDESWTTDLITGNWGEAPPEFGYNPSVLYDNQDGLGPVMGKIESPELHDIEEVNGREAYRITGSVQEDVISPLTAGTMTGESVEIEVWIDTETNDLLRVIVVEPESEEKDDPATWELNLSDFNEKVTIESPID